LRANNKRPIKPDQKEKNLFIRGTFFDIAIIRLVRRSPNSEFGHPKLANFPVQVLGFE